jgi:TonB family protein
VDLPRMRQWIVPVVLAIWLATVGTGLLCARQAAPPQQEKSEEIPRKAKVKIEPVYPDVARRMSIVGTVRLAIVVAPNGTVRSSKPVGGHPLLVNAATEAVRRWRFEPGPTESSGIVEFRFQPQN